MPYLNFDSCVSACLEIFEGELMVLEPGDEVGLVGPLQLHRIRAGLKLK